MKLIDSIKSRGDAALLAAAFLVTVVAVAVLVAVVIESLVAGVVLVGLVILWTASWAVIRHLSMRRQRR